MRTELALRTLAKKRGMRVEWIEMVPIEPGSSELVLTSKLTFEDPWDAARFLLDSAKEDAVEEPEVRAWSLAILKHTAAALGEDATGPTISPRLRDAFVRELHRNVQRQIKFLHERKETFQSAGTTMRLGAGDCDDHARLLYALARAANVRAKMVFFERDDQPVHVVVLLRDSQACGGQKRPSRHASERIRTRRSRASRPTVTVTLSATPAAARAASARRGCGS